MTDFPSSINIELTNRCNLRCKMCTNPITKRPKHDMDWLTFLRVLHDLKQYPHIDHITPNGLGEVFTIKDWTVYFAEIKRRFPNIPFCVVSNGVLLNEENADRLVNILNEKDSLLISLNTNREEYQNLMGVNAYDIVKRNIEYLLSHSDRTFVMKVQYMHDGSLSSYVNMAKFIFYWKSQRVPPNVIYVRKLGNWGGMIPLKLKRLTRVPCPSLWSTLMIANNGNIYPCCEQLSHLTGSLCLGNIMTSTLTDAVMSKRYQEIREAHTAHNWDQFPECRNCDFWAGN